MKLMYLVLSFVFALPLCALARDIAPVVSGEWLEKNLNDSKLVIIDIRKVEEYKEGNIPNSINIFYGTWDVKKQGLDNELPEDDDLFDAIGSAGITAASHVVVVGNTDSTTDQANLTRVAWTLLYRGVENVAILDGGLNAWKGAKKTIPTEVAKPKAGTYQGKANKALFEAKAYVLKKIGKAHIVDTRQRSAGICDERAVDRNHSIS
ncbi:MAG: hypothetical protein A2X92_01995 [Syntrophus sp. GWC2_56_31]|nr:MAG: hypothetical protein A2X92_01995 [Syntrophus sp. GWC2_56_31]